MKVVSLIIFILVAILSCCLAKNNHKFNESHILHDFVNYGGEYDQAMKYFSVTSDVDLENHYFYECYQCFFSGKMGPMQKCIDAIKLKYGINVIYNTQQPQYASNYTDAVDCQYNISLINIHLKSYSMVHFNLNIKQSNCNYNYPILGGTTFDIMSQTNDSITSCKYHDHYTNDYTVTCIHYMINPLVYYIEPICMNLTLFFYHEHFGTYSEIKKLISKGRNQNITQSFCGTLQNHQIINEKQPNNNTIDKEIEMKAGLLPGIEYITGIWTTDAKERFWNNRLYYYDYNDTAFHRQTDRYWEVVGSNNINNYNSVNNDNIRHRYFFQPIFISNKSVIFDEGKSFHFIIIYFISFLISVVTGNRNHFEINEFIRNANQSYYFIGASHSRFHFDAVLSYIYNKDLLSGVFAVHQFISFYNMYSFISTLTMSTIFADDQTDFLQKTCQSLKLNSTILFQTGTWDLQFMR